MVFGHVIFTVEEVPLNKGLHKIMSKPCNVP